MTETIPTGDWQFWAATALAIGAMWLVLRPLLPTRSKKKNAACPGCPSGDAACLPPRAVASRQPRGYGINEGWLAPRRRVLF